MAESATNVVRELLLSAALAKSDGSPEEKAQSSRRIQAFAESLKTELAVRLGTGSDILDPVREEDDWDIYVVCQQQGFTVSISLWPGEGPLEPEDWVVTVLPDANPWLTDLRNPEANLLDALGQLIGQVLAKKPNVTVITASCSPDRCPDA